MVESEVSRVKAGTAAVTAVKSDACCDCIKSFSSSLLLPPPIRLSIFFLFRLFHLLRFDHSLQPSLFPPHPILRSLQSRA